MNSKELTSIALKAFAIYVMVQTILVMPSYYQAFSMMNRGVASDLDSKWFATIGILAIMLLVGLAVLTWKLANKILIKISKESEASSSPISEEFLLSLLGLYLAFEGLLRVCFQSVGLYYKSSNPSNPEGFLVEGLVFLLGHIAQVIIGVTLVVKARGWHRLLLSLKEAGLKKNRPSNKSN